MKFDLPLRRERIERIAREILILHQKWFKRKSIESGKNGGCSRPTAINFEKAKWDFNKIFFEKHRKNK